MDERMEYEIGDTWRGGGWVLRRALQARWTRGVHIRGSLSPKDIYHALIAAR